MEQTTEKIDLSNSELFQPNFESEGVLKILLLEDVPSDAELVSYYLGDIPFKTEIKHVDNKHDYFKEINDFQPNAVISDFQLPQYTGKDALVHLRSLSEYIPFIICTGRINEETAVECIKLGADDYVLKDDLSRIASALTLAIKAKKDKYQKDILTTELIRREENLRAITENSPSGIYSINKSGKILFSSRLDDKNSPKVGDDVLQYTDSINHEIFLQNIQKCWEERINVEFELKPGAPPNEDWFNCKMGPVIIDNEVKQLVFIPHKITELRKAHRHLDELNTRLNLLNNHLENVRDEEKKKIAMEIHDQLGQELTGSKLGLYWLKENLKSAEEPIQEKLNDLVELSTQVIGTVRRIAHELRPVVLDDIGLIAALEWHISNFNKQSSTQCELITQINNENFDKDLATALYRITQESLTNIIKHAEATKASVILKKCEKGIKLLISDNGIGVCEESALNSKSMGIFGMQERIKPWGGSFKILNNDPGTLIQIELKLSNL